MTGMSLAGIDDAFKLGIGKDAGGEKARRQVWPV